MKTKIEPISKSKTVDYSSAVLQNVWYLKKSYVLGEKHSKIKQLISSIHGESVICILTEEFTDKNLLETLLSITQANSNNLRVYILVNQYSKDLGMLSNHCLIRYEGFQAKGTFILLKNLSEKKPKGIFFTGRLTEQSLAVSDHLIFDIDEQNISKLYTHFCYLFWHSAKKEVIKEKHQEVTSRPLDVFHDPFEYKNRDYVYGTLFQFSPQVTREVLKNIYILYLNRENQIPMLIKSQTQQNLGNNVLKTLLPRKEFEKQEPELPDDAVSSSICYSWINIPFYLPKNSIEHSLYNDWRNKQKEILQKLNLIGKVIEEVESKEKSISKKLARFFLGKKTTFSKFTEEIEELKKIDYPNLNENKLKEKINRINEIYKEVQGHAAEIEIENHNAKIDEEIEEIKNKISKQQKELEAKKQELNTKEKERDDKIQNFYKKYGYNNSSKLDEIKGQLSKKSSNKKENMIEKQLEELQDLENTTFIQKLKDDISKIEKQIKKYQNDIENKEKEKNKEVKPNEKTSALDELDSSSKSQANEKGIFVPIPNLPQLPQTGKLYQLGKDSYLAIEFWEEYEQGKKEAERLKAKLCAIY